MAAIKKINTLELMMVSYETNKPTKTTHFFIINFKIELSAWGWNPINLKCFTLQ